MKCEHDSEYSDKYDAYFCGKCNSWLTPPCGDDSCDYCSTRPLTPLYDFRPNEYKKLRTLSYPALVAYKMAFGDLKWRYMITSYSGKKDCEAYSKDIIWSGYVFSLNGPNETHTPIL
jgi:hypothetical protein